MLLIFKVDTRKSQKLPFLEKIKFPCREYKMYLNVNKLFLDSLGAFLYKAGRKIKVLQLAKVKHVFFIRKCPIARWFGTEADHNLICDWVRCTIFVFGLYTRLYFWKSWNTYALEIPLKYLKNNLFWKCILKLIFEILLFKKIFLRKKKFEINCYLTKKNALLNILVRF